MGKFNDLDKFDVVLDQHFSNDHSVRIGAARIGMKFDETHLKNMSNATKKRYAEMTAEEKEASRKIHADGYKKISADGMANIKAARQIVRDETRDKMSQTHKQRHAERPVTEETKAKTVATRRANGSYNPKPESVAQMKATKSNKSPTEKFWESTAQPLIAGKYGVFESRKALVAWSKESKIWSNAGGKFDKLKLSDPTNYKFISKEEYVILTGKYK